MVKFKINEWYTVEFADGEKLDFKFLGTGGNPASVEYDVELCSGKQTTIVLRPYKNIVSHGEASPCKV